MHIELELVDAFDGLTRILQVLRLSECRILGLDVTPAGTRFRAVLAMEADDERSLLVRNRLGGIIGVTVLRSDALNSVAAAA
ncbi:hypothetical protein [Enterovirga rhinocerotis]|uniref:Uncharacterized protein n=1 Tax=Enterovirga rhinocerotis TaxID=1339210 RepID=A0A4V3DYL1_9HYPH|nr:hypothetical protein [Enterovirga rhinocerotis]TDR93039.1 hypothetical protein EV668_0287 [Enterovirga rhinocerotis]